MDLKDIDVVEKANEGFSMVLKHPGTGEDTDIVIRMRGFDSDAVREAERATYKKLMKRKETANTADQLEALRLAKVKAAIISIEGLTDGGKEIRTPAELDPYLSTSVGLVILEQVNSFANDRANLFQEPSRD
ncbi:MAG: hypothetical protein AAF732_21660 [Pseudomonadota bacterium]